MFFSRWWQDNLLATFFFTSFLYEGVMEKDISMPYEVVILWWGLSWLTAALTILDTRPKTRICLLEWKGRIWGRVWSQKMKKNLYAELGAEWIGKNDTYLLDLCKRFLLQLIPHDFDREVVEHGTRVHVHRHHHITMRLPKKYQTKLNTFLAQFAGPKDRKVLEYDKVSLEDLFFQIFGWDSDSYEFEDLLESNEFAEDVKSVSAANYIMYKLQGWGSDGMDFKIAWGNDVLIQELTLYLKNQGVHFFTDTRVEEVTKLKKHFAVTSQKKTFFGDQVICALPIKAIGQIVWKPWLTAEKMRYINSIPYGRVTKRGAMTKDSLPEKMWLCDDTVLHTLYNAGRGQQVKKWWLLWLYASGDRAMILSKWSDKHFAESIKKHHPHIRCDSKNTYGYYRWNDPFTHGAFATYPAGTLVLGTKALAASVGSLHFCGEHTSLYHQGFMNGAVESGITAGTKVLRLFSKNKSTLRPKPLKWKTPK